ncbi:uncharacterized protein LOC142181855 [Nicotiana tabacum]|uniref:Uncharacterized protein LOC142181855 n=1 Tax=Nicotiana tabacum TaxID=4097 RepID=A0AC58UQ01_TOBAC
MDMLHRLTGFRSEDPDVAIGSSRMQQMCRAFMATQRDVCGFLPLLQVWVWERFLQLRPPLPQLPANVHIPDLPLASTYQRGRGIPRGGGRRAAAAPRRPAGAGRRGRGRRGGPQQGGFEAPADDVAADMGGGMHETDMPSYSLGIYDTPGTSQVTPSGQFLIMGSDFQGVELGRYFPGPSTTDESRPIRDFDSGHRLSYGSSSHAQASCDAATDDYIQDPDTIMPSTGPDSTTDTCHLVPHPAIRRRLDDDDPDSVPGRQGMRLRPTATLRHTGCGTH